MPPAPKKPLSPKPGGPKKRGRPKSGDDPAGYIKIVAALKTLLTEKGFQEITWGEIARTAGVSEALIYQYFKTRQGLLYAVLAEYLKNYRLIIYEKLDAAEGSLNKVRALIAGLLSLYADNRVFARILLLEVRNFQDYFDSEAYTITREYGDKYMTTLQEGIRSGEIRSDIPPARMRQVLLGGGGARHSALRDFSEGSGHRQADAGNNPHAHRCHPE